MTSPRICSLVREKNYETAITYSWFHIKGTWSVHSFKGDYLSIPEGTDSCGYLFHEIPLFRLDSGITSPLKKIKIAKIDLQKVSSQNIFFCTFIQAQWPSFLRKKTHFTILLSFFIFIIVNSYTLSIHDIKTIYIQYTYVHNYRH